MQSSDRLRVYMRQNNWPFKTQKNLNMAWFGMTFRQRRRWTKKMLKGSTYVAYRTEGR